MQLKRHLQQIFSTGVQVLMPFLGELSSQIGIAKPDPRPDLRSDRPNILPHADQSWDHNIVKVLDSRLYFHLYIYQWRATYFRILV